MVKLKQLKKGKQQHQIHQNNRKKESSYETYHYHSCSHRWYSDSYKSGVGVQSDDEPITTIAAVVHPALAAEDMEAEAAADVCCCICGKTPCEWLEYGVIAVDSFEEEFDVSTALENAYVLDKSTGAKVPNNKIRFSFYKMFMYEKFGHLGRGI